MKHVIFAAHASLMMAVLMGCQSDAHPARSTSPAADHGDAAPRLTVQERVAFTSLKKMEKRELAWLALVGSIGTVAELRAKETQYVALWVDWVKATIACFRLGLTLPDHLFRAFMEENYQIQVKAKARRLKTQQHLQKLRSLPGVTPILVRIHRRSDFRTLAVGLGRVKKDLFVRIERVYPSKARQ